MTTATLRDAVDPDSHREGQRDALARAGAAMSLLSALVAAWLHVKPHTRGLTANLLGYGLKVLGGALSPVVAVMGLLGAAVSRRAGRPVPALLGGLGAVLATRYVHRVSSELRVVPEREALPSTHDLPVLKRRWRVGQVVQRPSPRFLRDLVYASVPGAGQGETRDLLCDLWIPAGTVQRSGLGVIYLHGGAWQSFDKDVTTRPFFRHLAAQGHVVMDVAYRLAHETDMAGMLGDVKRAIAWLRANARRLGIAADRIVVSGGSAGGHLALMAAYTPSDSAFAPPEVAMVDTSVCGVFAFYPVADLRTLAHHWSQQAMNPLMHAVGRAFGYFTREGYLRWGELVRRLFGKPEGAAGDQLLAYSPVAHAGGHCPPTLILQGDHDHVVPLDDVRALHRSLVQSGCAATLVELPQVEHAFDLFARQLSPPAQAALYDVDRFLAQLM